MLKENTCHRFINPVRLALLILLWSAVPVWCADVAFLWDANTEPDIGGYGIYFKNVTDSEYSLWGYVSLWELPDPNNPRFVVSGIEKGKTYYFALTAYNWHGLESYLSNSVCVEVGDVVTECLSSDPGTGDTSGGGSTGSSGGGGGGGCFIGVVMGKLGGYDAGKLGSQKNYSTGLTGFLGLIFEKRGMDLE
jgi:hypothetical protein